MKICTSLLVVIATTFITVHVEGGRKVLLIPFNMNSHYLYFGRLGVEMAKLGDHVTMLVASSNKMRLLAAERFEVVTFQSRFEVAFADTREVEDEYYKFAMEKSLMDFYLWFKKRFSGHLLMEAEDLMRDRELVGSLKEKDFDFIIHDVQALQYLQVLNSHLNLPYAFLSIPFLPWPYGVPRLPSTVANTLLGYSDQLSFLQRLKSLLFDSFLLYLLNTDLPPDGWREEALEHYNVQLAPISEFFRNASLFLFLEDSVVGYPQASLPFVISMGDLMAAQPISPLPSDLQEFVKARPTILISFGSFFSHLPHQQTDKLCRVFATAKEFNFIWRFENVSVCGDHLDNLLIRSWLPQNDLLATVAGFVSHGGFNSMMEAVSHGTPLIVFPIAVDQHYQAKMAEKKGFGILMDLAEWRADDLLNNIRALVGSGSFKEAATRHSAILKHRQLSAAQRVSHAIDHVVMFGDGHLKGSSNHLNFFQLVMLDVFVFIFIVCFVIVFISVLLFRLLTRKLLSIVRKLFHSDRPKSE